MKDLKGEYMYSTEERIVLRETGSTVQKEGKF